MAVLEELKLRRGVSWAALAVEIGLSRNFFSRMRAGPRAENGSIGLVTLRKLTKAVSECPDLAAKWNTMMVKSGVVSSMPGPDRIVPLD